MKSWQLKERRIDARIAAMQHITAVSGGVKIKGRPPRFEDFMPSTKPEKVNPELAEARLKCAFQSWGAKMK